MVKFRIDLRDVHRKSGKTAYAVARDLNLNKNTVRKYLTEVVETDWLPSNFIQITEYLGIDWREVVITIEDKDPKTKPLLALPA